MTRIFHINNANDKKTATVCVVGAGIAGLTTAYRLGKLAEAAGQALDITILEAGERVGGVIETLCSDGLVMERGPDSLITEKPWGLALCREIGLESQIIPTEHDNVGGLIVGRGRLHPIPEGLHLMAPAKLWPFALSNLISWPGKFRMAADLIIPAKRDGEDESLGSFVRRRLGSQALDRIAQPMVGGIYTADPDRLSLAATMPRFIELEQKHGSVIRGLVAAGKSRDKAAATKAHGPRYDLFISLDRGLEVLPERLVERIGKHNVRFDCRVSSIERRDRGWRLTSETGTLDADAVCIAAPAAAASSILANAAPVIAEELAGIESASAATLNLVYRRADIGHPLNAFGFVVPAVERLHILACTFSSMKYSGRSPQDLVLLRTFVGGALSPENFAVDDETLIARAKSDLTRLLDIRSEPVREELSRYEAGMPQYHVGHMARIDRIEAATREHPGLALAGNAYRGTGIPDCIRSGEEAASRLAELLFAGAPTTLSETRPA